MRSQAAALLAATLRLSVTAHAAGADPCQLLTTADVKAAIPGEWKQNARRAEDGICTYSAADGKSLAIVVSEAAQSAAFVLGGNLKATGPKATPAPGPGSGAFRIAAATNNSIQFGKGKYVAHLEANVAATKDPAVLDRLAKTAYDRLP